MLDQRPPDSSAGGTAGAGSGGGPAGAGAAQRPQRPSDGLSDLYTQLFQDGGRQKPLGGEFSAARLEPRPAPKAPLAPPNLAESGLSLMQVCDLILKQLYLQGAA